MKISYKHIIILLFTLLLFRVNAQNRLSTSGAMAEGMGNASVTTDDAWSLYNNVGGIARRESVSILFSYKNRFGIKELSTISAGGIVPISFGVIGVNLAHFGSSIFSQNNLGLAYGNKFGNTSLGVKINYLNYVTEGYGSKGTLILEVGSITEITPQIWFGAHVYNITQSKILSAGDSDIPTIFRAGISYRPVDALMLNIEVQKELDFDSQAKIGLEYRLKEKFFARAGIQTNPLKNSFGLGYHTDRLAVDYAFASHPVLGFSHHMSVVYTLPGKE